MHSRLLVVWVLLVIPAGVVWADPLANATAVPSGTSSAEDNCTEPTEPAFVGYVDGNQATESEMLAAADQAKAFISQSDAFQLCLVNKLNAAKAEALKTAKTLDSNLEASIRSRIDSNQHQKEVIGTEINTAIMVYKSAHQNN
jgi:hypothetical protein